MDDITILCWWYSASCNVAVYGVRFCQQDLVNRGICTEAEATELVDKKLIPLVGEQQRKFEKMLESFDVS